MRISMGEIEKCLVVFDAYKKNVIVTTPMTTQPKDNLNTAVGLTMKTTVQTPPQPTNPTHQQQKLNVRLQAPQINISDNN